MPRRHRLAAALVGLACLAPLAGAQQLNPPVSEQVSRAFQTYEAAVKGLPLDGANYDTYKAAADAAVASLNAAALSVGDIEFLSEKMLIGRSQPATQRAVDERLAALMQTKDADGARAALVRTTINPVETTDDRASWQAYAKEFKARVMAALDHPGLPAAIAAGNARYLFATGAISPDLADDAYVAAVTRIAALPLPADTAPRLWSAYSPLVEERCTVPAPARERVRLACIDSLQRAAALPAPATATPAQTERTAKALASAITSFQGAYARGALVNSPAPDIEFVWTSAPGNPTRLSDLKGKVVVVDFWAVWCGPCVGSFPQVRDLQARYKDFPVVILGVTDLEGTPAPAAPAAPGAKAPERTVATAGPALALWAADKDVTWPLAIGSTGVFNPEYGVRGIPHVVIIDPAGVVRYRALHPGVDPAKKHEYIDGLLREFKLPFPQS